jgi:hypothetical protein
MLKRKVSCTFKREKISLDDQERIYLLFLLLEARKQPS